MSKYRNQFKLNSSITFFVMLGLLFDFSAVAGLGSGISDANILNTPNLSVCYADKDNGDIEVMIFNSGTDTIINMDLGWYYTDSQLGSVSWSGRITPNTGELITLTNLTFPDTGTYSINLWVDLGIADGNQTNDSLTISVRVLPIFDLDVLMDTTICSNTSFQASLPLGLSSYSWSNGAITSSLGVSSSGDYSVTITDQNGCVAVDSMKVAKFDAPSSLLPGDTILCTGDIFVPVVDSQFVTYSWGGDDTILTITEEGIYSITVMDTSGCTYSDTMTVQYLAAPNPIPNPQVNICNGDSATLNAASNFISYLWSTGEVTQSIVTPLAGYYHVTVTGLTGCLGFDTIEVVMDSIAPIIFSDSLMCNMEPLVVNPGWFSGYQWSNGSVSSQALFHSPGTYSVTVTNSNGCKSNDSFTITNQNVNIDLGPDRTTCTGDGDYFYILGLYDSYLWNNGDTGISNWVGAGGTYSVTVSLNGCYVTDDLVVTELPYPVAEFTEVVISPEVDFTNLSNVSTKLMWDFGDGQFSSDVNPIHRYTNPGVYSVVLEASNKCDTTYFTKSVSIFPQANQNIYVNESLDVYPTLANTHVNFKLDGYNLNEIEYAVFDIVGKLVYERTENYLGNNHVYSINVNEFASGTYYLRIVSAPNQMAVKPFVVR